MARKKRRNYQKNHRGAHHIIPTSRNGPNSASNLYFWPQNHYEKHTAWHALFLNMMPEEVMALISTWKRKDGQLDMRYFRDRKGRIASERLSWWKTLFGDATPDEAIAWIEHEFIRRRPG